MVLFLSASMPPVYALVFTKYWRCIPILVWNKDMTTLWLDKPNFFFFVCGWTKESRYALPEAEHLLFAGVNTRSPASVAQEPWKRMLVSAKVVAILHGCRSRSAHHPQNRWIDENNQRTGAGHSTTTICSDVWTSSCVKKSNGSISKGRGWDVAI